MTTTAPRYTFRALDMNGGLILQARGRGGALDRVMKALNEYREAVATGSGYLYGHPRTKGWYTVDGVVSPFGASCYMMEGADEVARLDRLGLARVAEIQAQANAQEDAA